METLWENPWGPPSAPWGRSGDALKVTRIWGGSNQGSRVRARIYKVANQVGAQKETKLQGHCNATPEQYACQCILH